MAKEPGIEDGKSAEHVKDLLLEDYRYRADSLWKNEQSGETRLNFYIGLVTVVIGALVSLATDGDLPSEMFRAVAVASVGMLLLFGLITFMRMLIRNEHTDLCKRGLDTIRQTFKDHFDRGGMLVGYYPIAQPRFGNAEESELTRKIGGLPYTVAVMNSALVGAMIAVAAFPSPPLDVQPDQFPGRIVWATAVVVLAVGAAVTTLFKQFAYIKLRGTEYKDYLREGMPTHAGGAVFRFQNDTVQYLIQRRKDEPDEWLLPKGHIERGEGHGETALREVREETGVVGRLRAFIVRTNFNAASAKVDAKFYLIEYIHEAKSHEKNREIDWLPFEAAVAKLSFDESQIVLREAERCRRTLGNARTA
jgi:8-oxo-dGTP pyrophosphatase MutT (NUDIX family)